MRIPGYFGPKSRRLFEMVTACWSFLGAVAALTDFDRNCLLIGCL